MAASATRPASDRWMDNLHPALRRCWHPVATADGSADGTEIDLLGHP